MAGQWHDLDPSRAQVVDGRLAEAAGQPVEGLEVGTGLPGGADESALAADPLLAGGAFGVGDDVLPVQDGIAQPLLGLGSRFDTVYKEGAYLLRPDDDGGSQSLDLAPAQGGFVETTFPEEGSYPLVDHDLRHAEAGTRGHFEVEEPRWM